MKNVVELMVAAGLVAGSAASHLHGHQHLHKKHAVEQRDPNVVTEVVPGPTATVYVLDGEVVAADEAVQGISGGDFVVVGESTPTFTPPPPPPAPTTSSNIGDEFVESMTTTKPTTTARPSTTSVAPVVHSSSPAPVAASSASAGGAGVDSPFPDGEIDCSHFPSDYGAVPLDYLGLDGWTGVQQVPNFSFGDNVISDIITAVTGMGGCTANSMCSYACPLGYQKSQWPSAQGNTGQSIGGLFCGSDNKLHLTRSSSPTICIPGEGGVSIQNDLSQGVATCRTDYPGTESMTIPAFANAGETIPLTNPNQNTYYQWKNLPTSAQYYVNNPGLSAEDACLWTSPVDPSSAGNWAPMNIGVGYADGTTYLSIFLNTPTSDATLGFNIEMTGDNTAPCYYKDGAFSGGNSHGCTTGMPEGGSVTIRYF